MEGGILQRVRFASDDIKSDRDQSRLEGDLGSLDGVRSVHVDSNGHSVDVTFDSTMVDANGIRSAIEDDGYSVSGTSEQPVSDKATQAGFNSGMGDDVSQG